MKIREYKNCIFCLRELPVQNKGEGEHVFPQNIFGVWHIYDVCEVCMRHFGDNVDDLGIKDPKIVRAMEELELPNIDEYRRNFQYIGQGHKNDKKNMIYKGGGYRIKINPDNPHFIEYSDPDELAGKNWLTNNLKKMSLDDTQLDQVVDAFLSKTRQMNPGDEFIDSELGLRFVKGRIQDIEMVPPDNKIIFPLLCKIAVCFFAYVEPLGLWNNNQYLVQSALGNMEVPEYKIFWASHPDYNKRLKRFHRVLLNIETRFLDISFFGTINYRILLSGINIDGIKRCFKEPIEDIIFVSDFERLDRRRFAIVTKFANREKADIYIDE